MTTDRVVLWGAGTMRTHRTLWLAEEMSLDYEHRPIGPRTGETKTDEFLAINPRHKIPAMVHGDIRLTESAAIMSYMTETFPVRCRITSMCPTTRWGGRGCSNGASSP